VTRIDWHNFDWSQLGRGWSDDLRVAAILFTRLPIVHPGKIGADEIAHALRAAPVVGLGVGFAGAAAFTIAHELGLSALLSALAALGIAIASTGAFHEDGLADFADGLGGSDAQERLAIMRDSRLGSYGALALFFALLVRAAVLAQLATPWAAACALLAAASLSRGVMPLVALHLAPVRRDGLGAMIADPSQETIAAAAVIGALSAFIALGLAGGVAAIALALGALFGVTALAGSRLGGYTGDVLGAAQQAAEVAVLLAAVIFT
jgi:adenosylcobinamide-GDP ribazoletransferase